MIQQSKKKLLLIVLLFICSGSTLHSQLAVLKMVGGKHSKEYKIGFGTFYTIGIPVNETGSQNISLELIDFAYFPVKSSSDLEEGGGYFSFKLGYRYIFSEESKTGFFVEPQAGFCLTAIGPENDIGGDPGKGIALAMIAGYSLEVGQRGNNFIFGLLHEADLAGNNQSIHSFGLRVAFNYSFLGKRKDRY
jgi:hypothetical protein